MSMRGIDIEIRVLIVRVIVKVIAIVMRYLSIRIEIKREIIRYNQVRNIFKNNKDMTMNLINNIKIKIKITMKVIKILMINIEILLMIDIETLEVKRRRIKAMLKYKDKRKFRKKQNRRYK